MSSPSSTTTTTTQAQLGVLLQSLLGKGLTTQEAIPTMKTLVESKIFSLDDLNSTNIPKTIAKQIQTKIFPKKKPSRKANHVDSTNATSAITKKMKMNQIIIPPVSKTSLNKSTILINRSPVLTLWASIVAKHVFSISFEEALTFGSAFSTTCAKSKGTRLGIYNNSSSNNNKSSMDSAAASTNTNDDDEVEHQTYELMNQAIDVMRTLYGLRAVVPNNTNADRKKDMLHPHTIWKSLTRKFGNDLSFVIEKMDQACVDAGDELHDTAYSCYEYIRPDIPNGAQGWGAHGHFNLSKLSNFYPIGK